jgi:ribonuclease T2
MKRSHYILLFSFIIVLFLLRRFMSPRQPVPSNSVTTSEQATAATATQSFDYYLLNLSWSPEFCATHPGNPECSQHLTFVLHGFWPQDTNGGYPEDCSNTPGPSDPEQYSDIYPDRGLLEHEWKAHGTCSGLAPDAFFHLARQAVHSVAIPAQLASIHQQLSMPPNEILGLFTKANPNIPASSLALSCGNNYLTAIEVCLSKSLQPVDCGPIHSCRANTVRIPPPQN